MLFGKKSTAEVDKSDTIDQFVKKIEAHTDVIHRILERLKQLEFAYVNELSTRSLQFYERELGVQAAQIVFNTLKSKYQTELKDMGKLSRAPGDPEPIDEFYHVPRF